MVIRSFENRSSYCFPFGLGLDGFGQGSNWKQQLLVLEFGMERGAVEMETDSFKNKHNYYCKRHTNTRTVPVSIFPDAPFIDSHFFVSTAFYKLGSASTVTADYYLYTL